MQTDSGDQHAGRRDDEIRFVLLRQHDWKGKRDS